MNRRVLSLFALLLLFITACEEKPQYPEVSMLPPFIEETFYFRGYVTDENKELVSDIYNFTRQIVAKDTVDGHPCQIYLSQGTRTPFFRDEDGTVFQKNHEDIGMRIVPYGFSYKESIKISYWQTMLKLEDGVESKWAFAVDTSFHAITMNGEEQQIRYITSGKAQFKGWTSTFIPAAKRAVEVLDAHWYDLQTYFINETTGDTLFSSQGEGHNFFTEHFGAVKYTHDFVQKELGKPERRLFATWEHVNRFQK
ncbi:MAG: hypothetical protein DWQ10_05715 [Calditrichaeota bacterium]|nr:MAG: hypothetical protein DWQ10_05715 [Calditrichota bacterium]